MEKLLVVAPRMSLASVGDDSEAAFDTELFLSFKGIDKGYNFFRSGHVQQGFLDAATPTLLLQDYAMK